MRTEPSPAPQVLGRAGRCLEAGEQSSVGLLDAVWWCPGIAIQKTDRLHLLILVLSVIYERYIFIF